MKQLLRSTSSTQTARVFLTRKSSPAPSACSALRLDDEELEGVMREMVRTRLALSALVLTSHGRLQDPDGDGQVTEAEFKGWWRVAMGLGAEEASEGGQKATEEATPSDEATPSEAVPPCSLGAAHEAALFAGLEAIENELGELDSKRAGLEAAIATQVASQLAVHRAAVELALAERKRELQAALTAEYGLRKAALEAQRAELSETLQFGGGELPALGAQILPVASASIPASFRSADVPQLTKALRGFGSVGTRAGIVTGSLAHALLLHACSQPELLDLAQTATTTLLLRLVSLVLANVPDVVSQHHVCA
jgi:hypothetical protein